MAGGPDDRPVEPDFLQHRLFVRSLVNMYRVIFDEAKQLHCRGYNGQDTPYYPCVKAPRPRRDNHKGPSNIRLFERMRDKHPRSLFLESCRASYMVQVSVSQKYQLHIGRFSAKTLNRFQYPLLTTRQPRVDEHQSVVSFD